MTAALTLAIFLLFLLGVRLMASIAELRAANSALSQDIIDLAARVGALSPITATESDEMLSDFQSASASVRAIAP